MLLTGRVGVQATLDLSIHAESPPVGAEALQALVDELRPAVTGIANPSGANMLRSFGHLMNQYSAAYYGYGPLPNRSVAHPFLLAAFLSKFIGEQ